VFADDRLPDNWAGPASPEVFRWAIVRDAAEQTAAELGVPVGRMTGYASVLDVDGIWWHLAGPGCALCSGDAARDPAAAADVLRAVFSSAAHPLRT
jgi:hypothetical protein